MQDSWEKFWNFIGIAFWVVIIGWFGLSLLTPKDTTTKATDSTYTRSYDNYSEYDSDYESNSSSDAYDSSYDTEGEYTPSYYRSTYSSSYDKDCSDFDSWDEAQYYYENIADDNLDRDEDGVACESLQ